MTESQGYLNARPYSDKSTIPFGIMEDRVPLANKIIRVFPDGIQKYRRYIKTASGITMTASSFEFMLDKLSLCYQTDIAAKDARIAWLEEYANAKDISVTEEMQRANDAEARITELEAQVQELIEELQDVVCFAPECTTSKEYAVKRLEELMSQYVFLDNKWEAK